MNNIYKIILTLLTALAAGGAEYQFNDEFSFYTAIASVVGGGLAFFFGNKLHKASPQAD